MFTLPIRHQTLTLKGHDAELIEIDQKDLPLIEE